jgi:SAM-dependent methyltransferase
MASQQKATATLKGTVTLLATSFNDADRSKVGKEEWAKFAPAFTRLLNDGPGIITARDILKYIDPVYPLSKTTNFLDVGCGPGQVTGVLVKEYGSRLPKSAKIIALDNSPEMIQQLKARIEPGIKAGDAAWRGVEVRVDDAHELKSIPSNSISHVVGSLVYFLLPQPRKAMEAARRVLTPNNGGGVFAMSAMIDAEWTRAVGFVKAVRPDKNLPMPNACWRSKEGLRGELEACGFRNVQVFEAPTYMPFEDHEEIVKYLVSSLPPMRMLTADMSKEEIQKVVNLTTGWLKKKYPTTPARMVGTALIAVGRK